MNTMVHRKCPIPPRHLLNFCSNGHPKPKKISVLRQNFQVSDILLRNLTMKNCFCWFFFPGKIVSEQLQYRCVMCSSPASDTEMSICDLWKCFKARSSPNTSHKNMFFSLKHGLMGTLHLWQGNGQLYSQSIPCSCFNAMHRGENGVWRSHWRSLASGDAVIRSTAKKYRNHGPQIVISQVATLQSISSQSTHIFSETEGFVQHHVVEQSALFRGTFFCQVSAWLELCKHQTCDANPAIRIRAVLC